jgi:hypothetical protein
MMTNKYLATILASLSLAVLLPVSALASGSASLNLSPSSGSYKAGQTFNVNIMVNPGSDKVDTVRTKLSFSTDVLEIKNFSVGSAFTYQAGANSFDNKTGTFSWGAGIPGGTTSSANFGTITFLVKSQGTGLVSISNDSLALSAGENKFNGQGASAEFSLLAAAVAGAPPKATAKNTTPVSTDNTQQVVQQSSESTATGSPVESQIITKPSPQSFVASMVGAISLGTAIRLSSVILIMLIIIGMGILIYRMRKDVSSVFRRIKK